MPDRRGSALLSLPAKPGQKNCRCNSTPAVQSASLLGHRVLQGLAGLENRNLGGGNLDGFLGLGVAADALGAALHLKGTEAHQLNLVALGQAVGNDLNGRVDGGLGILSDNSLEEILEIC